MVNTLARFGVFWTLVLGSAFGGSGFSQPAFAESGAEAAEPFIQRGVALRRSGNDVAALREFQHAWEISQNPRTSAQMGLCQQALGQWAAAQTRLLEALAAKDHPWVARNRVVLEKTLASAREHIGHLGG
jgi:Flp pilus assembly protein TadD